ncbi:hypothetical protein JCM8795_07900 [Hydrogenobaculum acidophilum]
MGFGKIDYKKYIIFFYKIRYVIYMLCLISICFIAFKSITHKKEKLYNNIAEYEHINFLIKNGKPKTKTLNEGYVRSIFSNTKLDYIKYENGTYNVKASNVNIITLANIVYQIENDGFRISFLKAEDYTGKQDFTVHMEISP